MADKVDINLDINAVKVIQTLNQINELAETASGKAQLLKKSLMDLSRATGEAPTKLLRDLQALQGKVVGGEQFGRFETGKFGVDVTEDVFRETAALLEADKALNKYATSDSKAAIANKNFDGSVKQVNVSVGEQSKRLQILARELNKLKFPTQDRNALGVVGVRLVSLTRILG